MLGDAIDELLGSLSRLFSALLHFLPVLIHAGEEIHLTPVLPLKARHDVSEHFFIRMADVWRSVRVVDGGGDVVGLHNEKEEMGKRACTMFGVCA